MRDIKNTWNETGKVYDFRGKEYPPKQFTFARLNCWGCTEQVQHCHRNYSFIFPVEHYLTREGKEEAAVLYDNWSTFLVVFLF